MKRDLVNLNLKSSFQSVEKDIEIILRKLFVENKPLSDELKKLLVINTKDCLDEVNASKYKILIDNMKLKDLREEGYILLEPKLKFNEHEEVKSYLIISLDDFFPNETNPEFRDCTVSFDIICHTDYWDIGNYRMRPLKIAGIIDGILNGNKLTGIGEFLFMGCSELILNEELAGYTLMFRAIHQTDGDDKVAVQ
jgi:hypothetical protein